MASTIKIKRSGVSGKLPSTNSLNIGELALNYADGILYFTVIQSGVTKLFRLIAEEVVMPNYGQVSDPFTSTIDYGFVTNAVTNSINYGELL